VDLPSQEHPVVGLQTSDGSGEASAFVASNVGLHWIVRPLMKSRRTTHFVNYDPVVFDLEEQASLLLWLPVGLGFAVPFNAFLLVSFFGSRFGRRIVCRPLESQCLMSSQDHVVI
jgi:hypothetical protein